MNHKTIALVQFDAVPEKKNDNLKSVERLVKSAAESGAAWIVFHEGTLTDYSLDIKPFAEPVPSGESTSRISKLAKEHNCFISFGLSEKEDQKYYLSQVFVGPKGYLYHYRKTWLCRYDDDSGYRNEWARYDPGTGPQLFEIDGIKASCIVCCDGSSPRCIQRVADLKPQLVFHPHNVRFGVKAESLASEAKAFNAPVLVTNRVGRSWTHDSPGGCAVISAEGEVLARSNMEGKEEILIFNLVIK
jgi:predicted amidohydrolase